ncbi:hypothetical protein chiPu_0012021 [Chiloscyllium punctatum]|uniref:Uncharacterized protein n=1 Tax=Chiloscyllium punctatum TaxID=137246 RepID=A0A401ST40_CHIPU|nr:hypothetical protein [Chiloscyllium punctatum]
MSVPHLHQLGEPGERLAQGHLGVVVSAVVGQGGGAGCGTTTSRRAPRPSEATCRLALGEEAARQVELERRIRRIGRAAAAPASGSRQTQTDSNFQRACKWYQSLLKGVKEISWVFAESDSVCTTGSLLKNQVKIRKTF